MAEHAAATVSRFPPRVPGRMHSGMEVVTLQVRLSMYDRAAKVPANRLQQKRPEQERRAVALPAERRQRLRT